MKAARSKVTQLTKGGKKVTKQAFQKLATSGIGKTGGKTLAWAVGKVGWAGIKKRAGWRLWGKLMASGFMKGAMPLTYGVSGLVSAGLDVWMAVDIAKLVSEISKEYSAQKQSNKGGSAAYSQGAPLNTWSGRPGNF